MKKEQLMRKLIEAKVLFKGQYGDESKETKETLVALTIAHQLADKYYHIGEER